jgi:hypothetical protein
MTLAACTAQRDTRCAPPVGAAPGQGEQALRELLELQARKIRLQNEREAALVALVERQAAELAVLRRRAA